MYVAEDTKLPNIDSIAQYLADIARHTKEVALNIRYWEILNEAHFYAFDVWNPDLGKIALIVDVFNRVARRIHDILPDALCGINSCSFRAFLDYFVRFGQGVGFLAFHKYDSWDPPGQSWYGDLEVLNRASQGCMYPQTEYTPVQMRDVWESTRGQRLPVICTETNLNGGWIAGTDPRIQQTIGSVWYAEETRSFIQMGVDCSIFYNFASSQVWGEMNTQTKGWGFGMMECDQSYKKWYPYLTHYLIASNLQYSDPLFKTVSSGPEVSALAWKNSNRCMFLVINKINQEVNLRISGISAGSLVVSRIDSSSENIVTETIQTPEVRMSGYTVLVGSFNTSSTTTVTSTTTNASTTSSPTTSTTTRTTITSTLNSSTTRTTATTSSMTSTTSVTIARTYTTFIVNSQTSAATSATVTSSSTRTHQNPQHVETVLSLQHRFVADSSGNSRLFYGCLKEKNEGLPVANRVILLTIISGGNVIAFTIQTNNQGYYEYRFTGNGGILTWATAHFTGDSTYLPSIASVTS
jgi:hypothetical protein